MSESRTFAGIPRIRFITAVQFYSRTGFLLNSTLELGDRSWFYTLGPRLESHGSRVFRVLLDLGFLASWKEQLAFGAVLRRHVLDIPTYVSERPLDRVASSDVTQDMVSYSSR